MIKLMLQIISIIFIASFISLSASEDIILHNKSELSLYAAVYNKKYAKKAIRYTPVKEIKAGDKNFFELPDFKTLTFREIVFSLNEDDIKDTLSEDQFLLLGSKNVGVAQGYNFYIIINPISGDLKSYNTAQWHVLKPVQEKLNQAVSFLSKKTLGQLRRSVIKDFPHTDKQAQVRIGTDLSNSEKEYIDARIPRVKTAVEKLIGSEISYVPRIALCGSGGGYRAMFSTLGNLQGAEQTGLLDTVLFACGLSGSTWALATWIESGLDAKQMNSFLKPRVAGSLTGNFMKPGEFAKELLLKYSFDQSFSFVDIYGALLASSLLQTNQGNPYLIHLSDQASALKNGAKVLPIYTAVSTKTPYEWLEFTPFEIGSDYLGGYIPTWSFGRKFAFGKSLDDAPEQPLGYLMGIWGSAFGVNFTEILKHVGQTLKPDFLKKILEKTFEETTLGRQRFFPAQVYNFMLGVPKTPRYQQTTLTLVDAGIDHNLPLQPLMRKERAVDIIIIFDASDEQERGLELKKAEAYFLRKGITFPQVSLEHLANSACTVLRDPENVTTPVLIYMPLLKNEKYSDFDPMQCSELFCNTFNFSYKPEEVDLLTGLSSYNMVQSKDILIQVIKEVIDARSKERSD